MYKKYENKIIILLFIVGILIRALLFWTFPAGLNQDEASLGYDAFADLKYGMDRNGFHNPVYSIAWGSGHSSLYISLSKPFIYLFGLNIFSVRIANVIFGIIALFAFYFLLKRIKGKSFAALGLFLLVISPWHIMMSRWGLDCNIFPNVFIIALFVFVKGEDKPIYYPISACLFSLSLYAYGTSYIIMPVFLLYLISFYLFKKKITVKQTVVSGVVFLIVALPILIFAFINVFNLKPIDLGFISFPKLINGRYNTTVTVLSGNILKNIYRNIVSLGRVLILQDDGLIWNGIFPFGTIYYLSIPFCIIGLFKKKHTVFNAMLISAVVLGICSEVNINRANIVFFPLIYLCAEGIYAFSEKSKALIESVIFAYVLSFVMFSSFYFTSYQTLIGKEFSYGAGQAILNASEKTDGKIYITEKIKEPYVTALFFTKADVNTFMNTVVYSNPQSSVRHVESFDRFITGTGDFSDETGAYVIEASEMDKIKNIKIADIERYGLYYVVFPKNR